MRLLNFTIIKLTICLILGIIIGYVFNITLTLSLYTSASLLVILFILFLIAKKQFIKTIWFGLLAFIALISVGILTVNLHNQQNLSNHYSNYISIKTDSSKTVTFRVRDVLKHGNYYDKYVIDILKIENKAVTGKSLLNIQKDSTQQQLKVDDILISKTEFKDLIPPLNPSQFDYKTYLEKQYIYHQIFTENQSFFKVDTRNKTLFGIADNIRTFINTKLERYNFKPNELAIINALLLGQKQDISQEVYTSYTNAGAIHILAISGLHIGIILLILSFVFKPIERFKYGKLLKATLLVTILWSFALIAGLSASVTRAVTMFSIVAIAMNLKRPTNVYNTLAISMFIILLFKPLFLFDVGFQLSYLAVFAIVTIDPLLFKLWKPKNKIITFYWHTLTVTVSAQLGIIPVSLFYFHQFPGLFFISNLVIIPFLGVILAFGLLIILLASINLLPLFLAQSYGYIISLMNSFVGWVSKQEIFLFKDISFNILNVLVSFLFIITLIKLFKKKSYANLKLFLIAILLFQCTIIYIEYSKPANQFIVFHKSRYSLIGHTTSDKIIVAHDFDSITQVKNNIIKDFTVGNHINKVEEDAIQSIYILNNKTLLILDSLGVYNINIFQPDYVLLRQSPKINLYRLIDSIKPKYIIADGSNYKSYVENWATICKKRKLPFHQTSKKGAFVIKY